VFDALFFVVSWNAKLISFESIFLVEKMFVSFHDLEEAIGAQAFKIIVMRRLMSSANHTYDVSKLFS